MSSTTERLVPVDVVIVHKDCECGGELQATGGGWTTWSTVWRHVCTKCGREECFDSQYPTRRFIERG